MSDTVTTNKALITALTTRVGTLETSDAATAVDQFFLIICAAMVFMMQAGFALFEQGSISAKNTQNILVKNVMDAMCSALGYWAVGYAFAFGSPSDGSDGTMFIGSRYFFMSGFATTDWAFWFFQWAFAATAATIVSGALAERVTMIGYMCYTVAITAFVYPVVVYWVWSADGWASAFRTGDRGLLFGVGAYDFAGSGVVHMVGGVTGLVATVIVGPRIGRFTGGWLPTLDPRMESPLRGSNSTNQTIGTLLLMFGWYGFNPGSMLAVSGGSWEGAARAAVTTTLSAASGGVSALLISNLIHYPQIHLSFMLGGILAGLVSITASCAVVEPYAAVIIGAVGGGLYLAASKTLQALHIDDPVDAFAVHGACGIWGVLATGAFATKSYVSSVYSVADPEHYGFLYGGGGNLLGAQIVLVLAIGAWVVLLTTPLFFVLRVAGVLRVSTDTEEVGSDAKKHGGHAFEWLHHVKHIEERVPPIIAVELGSGASSTSGSPDKAITAEVGVETMEAVAGPVPLFTRMFGRRSER